MKVTVVPAQITTVEDRITGSLSLSQLALLLTPLFLGSVTYVLLPPFFGYITYKLVIFVVLGIVCGLLAIRLKGQLLLTWLLKIGRYQLRPQYFMYTKNDIAARRIPHASLPTTEDEIEVFVPETQRPEALTLSARLQVEQLLSGARNLSYKPSKKGGLNVVISEVSQEG